MRYYLTDEAIPEIYYFRQTFGFKRFAVRKPNRVADMPINCRFLCAVDSKSNLICDGVGFLMGSLIMVSLMIQMNCKLEQMYTGDSPQNATELDAAHLDHTKIDVHAELWAVFGMSIIEAICAVCLIVGASLERTILILLWLIVESLLVIPVNSMRGILVWKTSPMPYVEKFYYLRISLIIYISGFWVVFLFAVYDIYDYYKTLRNN